MQTVNTNKLCTPQHEVPDGYIHLSGDLEHDSIVNGPGLRAVLWVQGCRQHCPGCQNPETWTEDNEAGAIVKIEKVKEELRKLKGVDFKYHAPDLSLMEATFALGGREMCDVLETAWRLGCRFDGWSDQFKYDKWLEAFERCGIQPEDVACRDRALDENLPWDHLDCGVSKEFLTREYNKAMRAETTQDCRKGCIGCGMKRYEGACV